MTYDEIVQEVYTLTSRSDLIAETASAVKAATLKAHMKDFYSRDLYETGVEFDTEGYTQSLDFVALITNFRSLRYFKRVEDAADTKGKFLTILTPEETVDKWNRSRTDIAYAAGRVLEIRSSVPFKYGILGCYVQPVLTPSTAYSSWIADLLPYAIIFEAARIVFKSIGLDAEAKHFESLVAEAYQELTINAVSDIGY